MLIDSLAGVGQDDIMETASSPRMGADVTTEQQRKHEQLADRARERAVVRSPRPTIVG